ncbi:MAG: T9SS type A sorting domain-containing protein, partial [Bacteroidota bacterium]
YYRLKMVDNDGSFTYSDVRIVKSDGATAQLVVSPNPFINQFVVTASLETGESDVSIMMTDTRGAIVLQRKISGLTEGRKKIQVNAPDWLAKGIYFLRVNTRKGTPVYVKLVKQ